MTELCPDCGRPVWTGDAPPDEASCVHATDAFTTYDDDLMCAELTITRLRRELAAARAIGDLERAVLDALFAFKEDDRNMGKAMTLSQAEYAYVAARGSAGEKEADRG